mmetsp:Transcript_29601/g.41151  ORF Transcript_29601/g.41151 Transcript_29601/m.41151 type:complete len:100 (-) Transcript_29601:213-512(-)
MVIGSLNLANRGTGQLTVGMPVEGLADGVLVLGLADGVLVLGLIVEGLAEGMLVLGLDVGLIVLGLIVGELVFAPYATKAQSVETMLAPVLVFKFTLPP